jgi:hypothetical protein
MPDITAPFLVAPPIALIVAIAAAGCGSSRVIPSLRVVSSISDGAALSEPVEWSALPVGVAPGDGIERVEFLIDGRLRWTDRIKPYFFNDDHRLYPWTIGSGRHTLAVRIVTDRHERVSTSSQITVSGRPPAPAALSGTYVRRPTGASTKRGAWRARFGRDGTIRYRNGSGTTGVQAFTAAADGVLTLDGSADWLDRTPRRGDLCPNTAVAGVYRWSVHDRVLELRARKEPCSARHTIFSGTWSPARGRETRQASITGRRSP